MIIQSAEVEEVRQKKKRKKKKKEKVMIGNIVALVLVICAALAASGCGVQIGTPDYWREYNESIRGGAAKRMQVAKLETITKSDREELGKLVRRVGQ